MGTRTALIISVNRYDDPNLGDLKTPLQNGHDLRAVLKDNQIGHFDKCTLLENPQLYEAQKNIANCFADANGEDLLLLYFSGHGIKDDRGKLYFAVSDTREKWPALAYTAIPASFIKSMIEESRSQRIVLLLDCCFSGAFGPGALGTHPQRVGLKEALEGSGYGRIVLAATNETRPAWEESNLMPESHHSIFSHFIIEGLKNGTADLNQDGFVTIDELFDYARENVTQKEPKQVPQRFTYKNTENLIIAANPFVSQLDKDLCRALDHIDPYVRRGALERAFEIAQQKGACSEIGTQAVNYIKRLAADANLMVATAAQQLLSRLTSKAPIDSRISDNWNPEEETAPTASQNNIWAQLEVGIEHDFATVWYAAKCSSSDADSDESNDTAEGTISRHFSKYGAHEALKDREGGLYVFWGVHCADRALLSSARLLETQTASQVCICGDYTRTRLDPHPVGLLASYSIDFVSATACELGSGGDLFISNELLRHLHDAYRGCFGGGIQFHGKQVHKLTSYDALNQPNLPDVTESMNRATDCAEAIASVVRNGVPAPGDGDRLRSLADTFYSETESLAEALLWLDGSGSDTSRCYDSWESIVSLERDTHKNILSFLDKRADESPTKRQLASILSSRSISFENWNRKIQDMSRPVLTGHNLSAGMLSVEETELEEAIERLSLDSEAKLRKLIDLLLSSDELEQDKAFTEIFRRYQSELAGFIRNAEEQSLVEDLKHILWQRADHVLLEEIFSEGRNRSRPFVLSALSKGTKADPRFVALIKMLRTRDRIDAASIDCLFASHGIEISQADINVILRCALAAHPDFNTKVHAVSQVPASQLWETSIHRNLGSLAILALVSRVAAKDVADDTRKILFDCICPRLQTLARSHESHDIGATGAVIYRLFEFDFFVEDQYFERLSRLLDGHTHICNEIGHSADHFSGHIRELAKRKSLLGHPKAKLPGKIEDIPKPVQRRLAREGIYIYFFVLHPDPRIARETLKHINRSNVGRVLQYRGLNTHLINELASHNAFFRARRNLELMLHHPKCPKGLARRQLGNLSFQELARLTADANANTIIRDLARNSGLRHASCTVRFAQANIGLASVAEVVQLAKGRALSKHVRRIAEEHLKNFRARRKT